MVPFTKNLSSQESLLYTSDGLTVKPLEIMLLVILVVIVINHQIGHRRHRSKTRDEVAEPEAVRQGRDPFGVAALVLGAAVIGGVTWGLTRGGDPNIAVLESVNMFYVPLVFLAATRLFTTIAHYRRLFVGILVAITVEAVHGMLMLSRLRELIFEGVSPLSHTAALQMNLLFLTLLATIVLRRRILLVATLLAAASIPTMMIYIESERRSAMVAALVGLGLLGTVLFRLEPARFKILAPLFLVVGVLYLGAFWNADGGIGFPARTVRNIISPDSRSYYDAGSDRYRDFENFNLQMTIRSNPILGLGYGQEFLQPIPLPKLTGNFTFADYSPHNAFLGLWFKAGFAGILSFVYLIAAGTATGIRSALGARDPTDVVMLFVLTANLPMTLVVSFVEIAFDPPTMTLFAVSLALVSRSNQLLGLPLGRPPTKADRMLARRRNKDDEDDEDDGGEIADDPVGHEVDPTLQVDQGPLLPAGV